ncbi:hypothetical protein Tco_0133009 [Tanacetum coccineum]
MAEVDINTLTMKQYLALSQENQAPGVVQPKIRGNVNFKIKSQFMRELREDTFFGNKNEDAHDHIDRVLSIVGLFNIPGVSKDADLLKKAFIQRYCPPSKTTKQIEDIHNFKQEGDKSLYQAWERYNDLLYKCPTHDINCHQKLNIFYKGLSTMNHQLLDSQEPILRITPAQALTTIQTMADHSQKWHNRTTSRNVKSSSSDGLAALVGCQICEGPHLDKDCLLNEEVKQVEEVRYGEFGPTALFNRRKKDTNLINLHLKESTPGPFHTSSAPSVEDFVWSKRKDLFRLWVIDWFTEALDPDKNPLERCFDEYKWVFHTEIEQLADEYEIKIGEKGQVLEEIWARCKRARCKNKNWWYDYWYEEEEKIELGNKDYDPLKVHTKTFEVTKYQFDNRCSFICVSDENNETLSLGRKNGSRFRKMIMEEMEEVLRNDEEDFDNKT